MKKITILFFTFLFISCGVKQTQSLLSNGDYDGAINRALDGLRTNKNSKGNQEYVYLLEEAFAKAKERDLNNLKLLIKENNPSNLERIYNLYTQLHSRQERVKAILPLKLINENRNAYFPFDDYSDSIIASKNDLSVYLYANAKKLMTSRNKLDARDAFDDLAYLDQLNPNYKDVRTLMDEAKFKGTDFVFVSTKNDTQMIIPARLQEDLLDFSTFGINDKWTVYHNKKQKDIYYDYGLVVTFRTIVVSPEQVREKQFVKEKQVKDGTKVLLDANGNPVKDQNGNNVMVDNMKTVTASIYEFTQNKVCQVTAKVEFLDNRSSQLIDTYPLSSEFVFNYVYATFNGDKRACEQDYFQFFDRRAVPFPTNEQMVYDSGEDLKAKLKAIITGNKFRR
ncbi:Probable lipoprotein precursor [Flavobacterium indicum GPTSA100-9 = DSM 17447]|uniref:Probable lipoprotein n=1 Tax=Flavobacterium indicum (strain DSM 17447 / CIP 109464 / GPTSA100-9) TaxID=1094466 RepID=H8XVD0_FLAIG|nr:hypothetical protein [Flavobacterium indicum]CCG53100.1 Probable lipoprotein precursor [Flavobacterium indicum GPTSA100-9 = DSM 17447]